MISNEEFGEIPKNWSIAKLIDYVDFIRGVEPGSDNYYEYEKENSIPFLRVGDLNSRNKKIFINKSLSKDKILVPNDIILSLDDSVGIVRIGLKGAYSTGIRKLVIKNEVINYPFLFCLVKSNLIQDTINKYATGTTILHAGKSINHMKFLLSDQGTLNDFKEITGPILNKILKNQLEIENIVDLKNLIIPKLILGEIDLNI